ncbi:MAG: tRNA (adenosine(37)-N6)-threonylcarbamoyltransferase complex dimerization subunit type 1 TsaB [Gammaproteobacteria bacterium]|nr:tRNA (adenosine(37)-N6)-threonylcarbamoyltransferase complex dimerization subunit type 1 TsaB [Gammaproteobacteria bacterium]
MKPCILAFEASSDACTVALQVKGEVYSKHVIEPRSHNELLLPIIQDLMKQANIGFADLDAIAFGAGPGSFVGVRIAASVVQGLAFAAQKPVIRLSSLQIMAQTAYRELGLSQIEIILDARMKQYYFGQYELSNGLMLSVEADSIRPNVQNEVLPELVVLPNARDMLPLAEYCYVKGELLKPEQALPIYLDEAKQWKKLAT